MCQAPRQNARHGNACTQPGRGVVQVVAVNTAARTVFAGDSWPDLADETSNAANLRDAKGERGMGELAAERPREVSARSKRGQRPCEVRNLILGGETAAGWWHRNSPVVFAGPMKPAGATAAARAAGALVPASASTLFPRARNAPSGRFDGLVARTRADAMVATCAARVRSRAR